MRGVGGEHDPAARGLDPHELQPRGVAADMVHGDPRRDLVDAVMELHPVLEQPADHRRHVALPRTSGARRGWHMQRPVQNAISRSCRWKVAFGNRSLLPAWS